MGSPPTQIGRYEVHGTIAESPAATVYLGRAIDGRLVAIKLFDDEDDGSKPDETRLLSLNHPNVCAVAEVRLHEHCYFVVMEVLSGVWISDLKPTLPYPIACRLISDAAMGLHAVHEFASIRSTIPFVHRGIRPDCFMLTTSGKTKLVKAGQRARTHSKIDRLAARMRYFAPEQLATGPIDRRTDVYALGILLWELTTGQAIHTGKSGEETALKIFQSKPRKPSSVIATYPAAVEEVVMRALAVDPGKRFPNAGAFASALQTLPLASDEEMAALARAYSAQTDAKLAALVAAVPAR